MRKGVLSPAGYDLEGAPTQSKSLLPGAGTSVPILFSVPEATQVKDLVFTLRDNDFSSDKAKVSDVRVSLTTDSNAKSTRSKEQTYGLDQDHPDVRSRRAA